MLTITRRTRLILILGCVVLLASATTSVVLAQGTDTDGDGMPDITDPDDDNDGVPDVADAHPLDPDICEDVDQDTCDDCAIGTDDYGPLPDNDPWNDGPDTDGDGCCDAGEPCQGGGQDTDGDGMPDIIDPDDDNDGVPDVADADPLDPDICEDVDQDTCDDCAIGTDDYGPLPDNDPWNDGQDSDDDGLCDIGDPCPFGDDQDDDGVCDDEDNCPWHPNPDQEDYDNDGIGDACDPCDDHESCSGPCPAENSCYEPIDCEPGQLCYPSCLPSHCTCDGGDWTCSDDCAGICLPEECYDPMHVDADADGIPDICDNCPMLFNPTQWDVDQDGVGDVCDNCPFDFNPDQSDSDGDGVGDVCDPGSGGIWIDFTAGNRVEWNATESYDSWNLYRGSLEVLRLTGLYTQQPGSNPLVLRLCGRVEPWLIDDETPFDGEAMHYLVTWNGVGGEGSLGSTSAGELRPNGFPCNGPSEQELCEATGGTWDPDSCGHYHCGRFPDCDAIVPGCDCGAGRNWLRRRSGLSVIPGGR
jgi:hypothetical protein